MKTSNKVIVILIAALIVGAAIFFKRNPDASVADIVGDPQKKSVIETKVSDPSLDGPSEILAQDLELREELNQVMEKLPSLRDIQNLHEDQVHFTPEIVNEGGALIGDVLEAADNDPARREETLKFFKACAENDSLIEAIRAVCWRTTLSRLSKWEIFLPLSEANVPQNIQDLATELPEL